MATIQPSNAGKNEHFTYCSPKVPFKHLTAEEADHFLTHGWIKVPGAMDPEMVDKWVADLWTRSGYDEHNKSTWKLEYLHMPFHRQVRYEDFAPESFKKITDIIGGEEKWDPVRERWVGDNFITNFGSEARSNEREEKSPKEKSGWHCDNDWFRQFLDSSGTALTVIHCFTDVPRRGGGTWVCEDGISTVCKYLYDHPEGLDPALTTGDLCQGIYECDIFDVAEAKKGDVFILHGLLPHAASFNYLHYARVITNTHVTLREPLKLSRPDKDYTLIEQVILRALNRESIPEFKPARERMYWYPRNYTFKEMRIPGEVEALIAAAKANGHDESSVDSIWVKGEKAKNDFDIVNGMLLPVHKEAGFEIGQHSI